MADVRLEMTQLAPAHDLALSQAAAELIDAGRWCAERGWVPATSGNLSRRLDERRMAITVSGRDKGALAAADFVAVALNSPMPPAVSAEGPLHASLYTHSADVGCVLHAHSLPATLLSLRMVDAGELVLTGYEMLKALAGIHSHDEAVRLPVLANNQDTEALAAAARTRLTGAPGEVGYLIAGHGLYAWGRDVAEARRHLEALDFLFACELEKGRLGL